MIYISIPSCPAVLTIDTSDVKTVSRLVEKLIGSGTVRSFYDEFNSVVVNFAQAGPIAITPFPFNDGRLLTPIVWEDLQ